MSNKYIITNPLESAEFTVAKDSVYNTNVKILTTRFKKLFKNLEADIKSKTNISKRGKLAGSRLYRYEFDSRIFKKTEDKFSDFDLTFVFLIDVSGSMSSRCKGVTREYLSRLDVSKAITKAISNVLKNTLKGKVGVEILLKACAETSIDDYGNPGFLSRVYSSFVKDLDTDIIDRIGYSSPISKEDKHVKGSSTPEMLLGKGIKYFLNNYISTKNYIIFNLTDGGTYCGMSEDYEGWWGSFDTFSNERSIKTHFKNVPFISIMIGSYKSEGDLGYPNPVFCSDSKFAIRLENVIRKVVKGVVE